MNEEKEHIYLVPKKVGEWLNGARSFIDQTNTHDIREEVFTIVKAYYEKSLVPFIQEYFDENGIDTIVGLLEGNYEWVEADTKWVVKNLDGSFFHSITQKPDKEAEIHSVEDSKEATTFKSNVVATHIANIYNGTIIAIPKDYRRGKQFHDRKG